MIILQITEINKSYATFLNFFGHCLHWNGCSSECVTWCSFNAPLVGKLFPHSSQINGRLPECTWWICALRLTRWLNRLSQCSHPKTNFKSSGKWVISCLFSKFSSAYRFGHFEHTNGFSDFGCFSFMCFMYRFLLSNSSLSHNGHLRKKGIKFKKKFKKNFKLFTW